MADKHQSSAAKKGSSGAGWRTYAAAAVALVVLIFILQNAQKVEFNFIFATTNTPLFFVIMISLALGALIGWLLPHVRRDRRREKSERDRYDKPD